MAEDQQVEGENEEGRQEEAAELEDSGNGSGQTPADYEEGLARYLEERIKPNLSRGTIPLLARSIAKELAGRERPDAAEAGDSAGGDARPAPDFEADMHELQAELGEDWILRFSVHGENGWLTAEKQDASQRVEALDAAGLLTIVEAIKEAESAQD
jgi:hypothetical protein